MGNIGSSELLIILVIALLLLGPKRLPDVGDALGKTIRRFRQASRDLRDEFDVERPTRGSGSPAPRQESEPLPLPSAAAPAVSEPAAAPAAPPAPAEPAPPEKS